MSVLIKGMEMPTQCYDCYLVADDPDTHNLYCKHTNKDIVDWSARMIDCPLVEVLTPHGPLIDMDEIIQVQMLDEMYEEWTLKTMSVAEYLAFAANTPPTIIEAEEGDINVSTD